jgi:hypothetical protein
VPYRWFSDRLDCKIAKRSIKDNHPADVEVKGDDVLLSNCVPASKTNGPILKGYKMAFALSAPGADSDDDINADLRGNGQNVAVFKTFNACYDAIDTTYSKTMKDLGADEDGTLLNDKTKSIDLTATCVRVY